MGGVAAAEGGAIIIGPVTDLDRNTRACSSPAHMPRRCINKEGSCDTYVEVKAVEGHGRGQRVPSGGISPKKKHHRHEQSHFLGKRFYQTEMNSTYKTRLILPQAWMLAIGRQVSPCSKGYWISMTVT